MNTIYYFLSYKTIQSDPTVAGPTSRPKPTIALILLPLRLN